MLVKSDKSLLGDTFLQGAESLAKVKETNRALTEKKKIHNQEFLANQEAAKGTVLPVGDFLRTIQKLNPNLLFKETRVWGRPALAIYIFNGLEPEYISGFFTDGVLPEYTSLTNQDERGLYSRTNRGWREVLVQLVKKGAISVVGAEAKLGKANGVRAQGAWEKQIQNRR